MMNHVLPHNENTSWFHTFLQATRLDRTYDNSHLGKSELRRTLGWWGYLSWRWPFQLLDIYIIFKLHTPRHIENHLTLNCHVALSEHLWRSSTKRMKSSYSGKSERLAQIRTLDLEVCGRNVRVVTLENFMSLYISTACRPVFNPPPQWELWPIRNSSHLAVKVRIVLIHWRLDPNLSISMGWCLKKNSITRETLEY